MGKNNQVQELSIQKDSGLFTVSSIFVIFYVWGQARFAYLERLRAG